jgi:hypothetical protein
MNLGFVSIILIIQLNRILSVPTQASLKSINMSKNIFYPNEFIYKRSSEQGKNYVLIQIV